jgi:Cu2+-exporting ATPase
MIEDLRRRFLVSTLLTIPILLLTPEVQMLLGITLEIPFSALLLLALSAVVFAYGGWPFLKGLVQELRNGRPGMMTLIGLAISVAFVYSVVSVLFTGGSVFFWELATLIDIMLLGHWLEMRSVQGASRALEELARIIPSDADLVEGNRTRKVPVEDLRSGDVVLVRPGSKVPVDGKVMEGESDVNEALLTGESRPVSKIKGSEVIGGAINGEGSLTIKVTHTGEETYLSQVIELVRKAQESRSHGQDLADRAALLLTIIAIISGVATLLVWLWVGQSSSFAVERAVTVMVICCPHALGLAIPLVVAISTVLAARSGFLIRQRDSFEKARKVDTVVFDKTGTLTEGVFRVVQIIPMGSSEIEVLAIAASLEARSEHSIARGIVESAREEGIETRPVEGFRAIPGKGVRGSIDGVEYSILSPRATLEDGINLDDKELDRIARGGRTVVVLVQGNKIKGLIAVADRTRKESKEAVDELRSASIKCVMLTGDNKIVAETVATDLGLDDYIAEVAPSRKAEVIKSLQEGHVVAMVGDGVNDAPALVQADIGIAIGAGTDVAVESADIILVRNDPRDVPTMLSLSRRTYSKMVQNLLYATGYNAVAIPLAAGVLAGEGIVLTPAIGAALMSISTIVVAINARLLR